MKYSSFLVFWAIFCGMSVLHAEELSGRVFDHLGRGLARCNGDGFWRGKYRG